MRDAIKKDIVEESILLASTFKWIFYGIIAGAVVGTSVGLFLKLLLMGETLISRWHYYFLLVPFALFLSSYIVLKLAPDAGGHGTEKAIEAVHKRSGRIDMKVAPVKLLASFITLSFGGSAGEEGPSVQIGAGVASSLASLFRMSDIDRRRFVICGISAGFSAVFGTPIGAAILAIEVLYIGRISYDVLLPSLIASYVSYSISEFMGISHISATITVPLYLDFYLLLNMIVLGILLGFLAILFIKLLHGVESFFRCKVNIYRPLKGLIGGSFLVLITLITGTRDYIGIGKDVIHRAITGSNDLGILAFLIKTLTVSITLGSGGSGGILTPIFYIGATAGYSWGHLVQGNIELYSAVGIVAFLAAAINTPLAAIVMAIEMFGLNVGVYATVACAVSYIIVGHRSALPSQILAISKTPSIDLDDLDCELSQHKTFTVNRKLPFKFFL